jgi:glutathione synthase/RimK-type ligase-like ATP-grasp enzyme
MVVDEAVGEGMGQMRIALLGPADDGQILAVARALARRGVEVPVVPSDALEMHRPVELGEEGHLVIDGQRLDALRAVYVRSLPSPHPPLVEAGGEWVLRRDWFAGYMQARERTGFLMAALLCLEVAGVRLVNPPQAGAALQSKPLQLQRLRRIGAPLPRTLISNDPERIRAFHAAEVGAGGEVIFKPLLGGATTRLLDGAVLEQLEAVRAAPVIFQQRIRGDDIRVVLVGDTLVSAVAIRTPEPHLDFREDPVYRSGEASYEPVGLPVPVEQWCRQAAAACGLVFAGIDLKRTASGEWLFLELNSSPVYLDVECKLGHPISESLAALLIGS